jgi:hypothetical protein
VPLLPPRLGSRRAPPPLFSFLFLSEPQLPSSLASVSRLAAARCASATSSTSLARGLATPPHPGHDGRGSGVTLRLPLSGGALLPKAAVHETECNGGARGTSRWHGAGARSGLPLLTLSSSAAASASGRVKNLGFPLLPMVGRGRDVAAHGPVATGEPRRGEGATSVDSNLPGAGTLCAADAWIASSTSGSATVAQFRCQVDLGFFDDG